MSTQEKNNTHCKHPMENRSGENGETNRRLNLYACVSVMAASILSAIYGYGD